MFILILNILVGLKIDYTCLGGSWNENKFGNPCSMLYCE